MAGFPYILAASASVLALAGCASTGELTIRAKPTGLAAGERPASFRIDEARGQFALGNVALALEGFRKALREDPRSTDAMNGIAACYDRMGRFDLSRRFYEMALASAPNDMRLYANLALSLDLQGRPDEAAALRAESSRRSAALQAGDLATQYAAEGGRSMAAQSAVDGMPIPNAATPSAGRASATTEPQEVSTRPAASVSIALPLAEPHADGSKRAHLERLSTGEVALLTSGALRWQVRSVERAQQTGAAPARLAKASATAGLTLLNAARRQGLAARTRMLLRRDGVDRITIGDAAQVRRLSVIAYPSQRRAEAVRIANNLGFALQHKPGSANRLIVYLGQDAAAALHARRP